MLIALLPHTIYAIYASAATFPRRIRPSKDRALDHRADEGRAAAVRIGGSRHAAGLWEFSFDMRIAPLLALAALVAPLPAFAHADLVSATPAADATTAPTSRIQLVFSERVVRQFTGADVAMTSMPGMRMNAPTAVPGQTSLSSDGKTLVVTFARPLAKGSYRVAWHAAAADGHREQGSYSFRVQ